MTAGRSPRPTAPDPLAKLNAADELGWSRVCVDGSHVCAKRGKPAPVDRRKTGSEHHLICDGCGASFGAITAAGGVNDITQTLALVDGIPPVVNCASAGPCRSSPARAPNIKGLGELRYVVE
jgi:hypothetical protein